MAKKNKHENLGWGDRGGKQRRKSPGEEGESELEGGIPGGFVMVRDSGLQMGQKPNWFIRIFVLPHTIIGLCLPFVTMAVFMTSRFGIDTTGTITELHGAPKSHAVHFDFTVNNKTEHRSDDVPYKVFKQLKVGEPVQIRYWSVLPIQTAVVQYENKKDPFWGLLLATLFWDAVILPVAYFLYVVPFLQWFMQMRSK